MKNVSKPQLALLLTYANPYWLSQCPGCRRGNWYRFTVASGRAHFRCEFCDFKIVWEHARRCRRRVK
jgi:hypothetical protein